MNNLSKENKDLIQKKINSLNIDKKYYEQKEKQSKSPENVNKCQGSAKKLIKSFFNNYKKVISPINTTNTH